MSTVEAIKSNFNEVRLGDLDREGMDRKIARMVDVWDMTAVARCRIKASGADTKERVRYLWEIGEGIGMEPVDANPGEIFLRKIPSVK